MDQTARHVLACQLHTRFGHFDRYCHGTAPWEDEAGDLLEDLVADGPFGSRDVREDIRDALALLLRLLKAADTEDMAKGWEAVREAVNDDPMSQKDVEELMGLAGKAVP